MKRFYLTLHPDVCRQESLVLALYPRHMSSATRCPILGMFTHHIHKILDNVALLQMRTEYGHLQIDLGLVTQPLLRHSLKQSRNEP